MMNEEARIIWCGNLSSRCNEEILYELFLQAGPVEKVNIPKDRDGNQKNFGFITFRHAVSVPYALDLFDGTTIYNRLLTIKARQSSSSSSDQSTSFVSRKINTPKVNEMGPFGNQVLMGYQMPLSGYNMMPMFTPPGLMSYPSQNYTSSYSHGTEADAHSNRNHPYSRDREHNRDRDRRRDYDCYDNKGERNYRGREHHRNSRNHRSNDNRSGRNHR